MVDLSVEWTAVVTAVSLVVMKGGDWVGLRARTSAGWMVGSSELRLVVLMAATMVMK
jgi:hypothetical protein